MKIIRLLRCGYEDNARRCCVKCGVITRYYPRILDSSGSTQARTPHPAPTLKFCLLYSAFCTLYHKKALFLKLKVNLFPL